MFQHYKGSQIEKKQKNILGNSSLINYGEKIISE